MQPFLQAAILPTTRYFGITRLRVITQTNKQTDRQNHTETDADEHLTYATTISGSNKLSHVTLN